LDANHNNHDDEHGEDFAETRVVAWRVAFGEEERAYGIVSSMIGARIHQKTCR